MLNYLHTKSPILCIYGIYKIFIFFYISERVASISQVYGGSISKTALIASAMIENVKYLHNISN